MTEVRVTVRPVALPHGPRETMAKLRGQGRHALLESALVQPGRSEWSYVAGPARATLYTDTKGTWLHRPGAPLQRWDDPFAALHELARPAGRVEIEGESPQGLDFVGGWVGVLSYDLARRVERLPSLASEDPPLPEMWWMAADLVLAYHHPSARWWQCTAEGGSHGWPWSDGERAATWRRTIECAQGPLAQPASWRAGPLRQRMERAEFEQGVQAIRQAIADGEVLQVNLTRREDASFEGDPWALYEDLVSVHPVPHAAYVEGPGFALASCSPERFLQVREGVVEARPIKGTAARGADAADDEANREWLATSAKNRAENLMIVDLMRNDLGRVAAIGSVQAPQLFALEPYASVWQMVSTVTARLREGEGAAELLRACWPPGSMTGAPKPRAMQVIERLEPLRRGFYAGSIGTLDCRGGLDLSVVIRSAVVADGRVMLQLGGGIVADSQPAAEWDETVAKGERLRAVLASGGRPGGLR